VHTLHIEVAIHTMKKHYKHCTAK